MKSLLLAIALISTPLLAADPDKPPEDMYQKPVRLLLNCFDSIMRLVDILGDNWGETPLLMSKMSDVSTIIVFSNKDKTTSTFVVNKTYKDSEEACIMWSGESDGLSFSLNGSPVFPVIKDENDT